MEIKKSKKADLEDKRTARFLLSFAVVLTAFFVAFEYSSDDSGTIDTDMSMLDELHRKDDDMIPLVLPVRLKMPEARNEKSVSDRMKILDDDAEIVMPEEKGSDTDGDADKILDIAKFEPPQPDDAEDMPPILNPDIDDNPLNFRIVEQLPEYPGGPVEFMRWLTLNLKYPDSARRRKVQGRCLSWAPTGPYPISGLWHRSNQTAIVRCCVCYGKCRHGMPACRMTDLVVQWCVYR